MVEEHWSEKMTPAAALIHVHVRGQPQLAKDI